MRKVRRNHELTARRVPLTTLWPANISRLAEPLFCGRFARCLHEAPPTHAGLAPDAHYDAQVGQPDLPWE
jgi:hypothetical protein